MYFDNLLGGLAMSLAGRNLLRLGFHIFVVIVGGLILSGAVNTSIIGANGVLNRVAEDGVLLPIGSASRTNASAPRSASST